MSDPDAHPRSNLGHTMGEPAKHLGGSELLGSSRYNKGTAFSKKERAERHLVGLLPSQEETISQQADRLYSQVKERKSPMEKFLFLRAIKTANVALFYRLIIDHVEELTPIVYTPTVGEACLQYSKNFVQSEGLYLSKTFRGSLRKVLDSWKEEDVQIVVVTDGSRILGLGDIGLNGMGIPVGKLGLYVTCAGFHPHNTLPIVVDVGTDNEDLLKDPSYLGIKEKRISEKERLAFMDELMEALYDKWPGLLVQFEDFATPFCFDSLQRYRNKYLMFNDDIQGTGAVILSGFIVADRLTKRALGDHRFVVFGAGSAGTGVSEQLVRYLKEEGKMSEEEARGKFWMLDSKGLLTKNRGDELSPQKAAFARGDNGDRQYKTLKEVVEMVKPTVLLGFAAKKGAFSRDVVSIMAKETDRPIIFPLSNPTDKSECTFEEAIEWTDGKVLFASGSPFDPVERNGETFECRQGNNMYVFPGISLGGFLGKCEVITDEMVMAGARELADCVEEGDSKKGKLYPPLHSIRSVSARIATAVILCADRQGKMRNRSLSGKGREEVLKAVEEFMFDPAY